MIQADTIFMRWLAIKTKFLLFAELVLFIFMFPIIRAFFLDPNLSRELLFGKLLPVIRDSLSLYDDFNYKEIKSEQWDLNSPTSCFDGVCEINPGNSLFSVLGFKYSQLNIRIKVVNEGDGLIFGFLKSGTEPYAVFWMQGSKLYVRSYDGYSVYTQQISGLNYSDFHVYSIEWMPDKIKFYIDDTVITQHNMSLVNITTVGITSGSGKLFVDRIECSHPNNRTLSKLFNASLQILFSLFADTKVAEGYNFL